MFIYGGERMSKSYVSRFANRSFLIPFLLLMIVVLAVYDTENALALDPPYPSSSIISDIEWDFSSHRSKAPGSDNWPITWADDDNQYTSWGDGGGFGGTNSDGRVSLGVARIAGSSTNFQGFNVWAGKNPENPGQFEGKSYGILSVDGILYMWLRQLDGTHAKLAVSTDHGATWTKATWDFSPSINLISGTFLNFGKDYAGAKDNYVYSYFVHTSSGSFTVFKPGQIDLARVPKGQIMNKNAYEFFTGLDGSGNPKWTSDISARQPVFEDLNGVGWTVSVSYNAALGRYFLCTEHSDTFKSNLGIFDAPTPWGQWTTTAYYDNWGNFNGSFFWNFSNKWLSASGKDFTMVFSGVGSFDSWNTVKGRFILSGSTDSTLPTVPQNLITNIISGTQINLTWQSSNDPESGISSYNIYRDGASVGQSATASYIDTGLNADTTYTYEVAAVNGAGGESPKSVSASATTFVGTPLPAIGLISYWRFDDGIGTIASDSSGNGNTGNLMSGTTWATGKLGDALSFDGQDDYVDIGYLDVQSDGFTFSVWFNAKDTQGDQRIISKSDGVSTSNHLWALILSANKLQTRLKINGSTTKLTASTGFVIQNTWTHAAVTFNGDRIRMYKDGVEIISQDRSGFISTNNTIPVWIGANPPVTGDGRGFNGLIDDARIYNRALSTEEIQALFNNSESELPDTIPPGPPVGLKVSP